MSMNSKYLRGCLIKPFYKFSPRVFQNEGSLRI